MRLAGSGPPRPTACSSQTMSVRAWLRAAVCGLCVLAAHWAVPGASPCRLRPALGDGTVVIPITQMGKQRLGIQRALQAELAVVGREF